jgi:hypothetical protein
MKALIIILALVAVSFVGLLVYGKSRANSPQQQSSQPPGFNSSGGDPKADDLDSWDPPDFGATITSLQTRFARKLDLKPPVELANSQLVPMSHPVDRSKDWKAGEDDPSKIRMANIALTRGTSALLSEGKSRLCLCTPGASLPDAMFEKEACDKRWQKRNQSRTCDPKEPSQGSGVLPIREAGGTITIFPGPPAAVTIK